MLKIFMHEISPRSEYIFDFIFQDIIGLDIGLTADSNSISSATPCINYSTKEIPDVPFITPNGLLSQSDLTTPPDMQVDKDCQFFHCESDLMAFDVFSASFYLLSRYEEYHAAEAAFDKFGRFRPSVSLMGRNSSLMRPLVDEWAIMLKGKLKERFPSLEFRNRSFKHLPTFDIDVAFAYGGRGALREIGSKGKDLLNFRFKRLKERRLVAKGARDPYDTYEYQKAMLARHAQESMHFILLGDKGEYDRNLSHKSKLMQGLIPHLSSFSTLGIHPSMGSNNKLKQLKRECKRLKVLTGREVKQSRQHYLNFQLPATFQELISAGIESDYSMGYAEYIGFRAGTCTPHKWFDLSENKSTALNIFPLSMMDSSLKDYMGLSPGAAKQSVSRLIESVKAVNGTFISLWHNHSINDRDEWSGWKEVFEFMMQEAK